MRKSNSDAVYSQMPPLIRKTVQYERSFNYKSSIQKDRSSRNQKLSPILWKNLFDKTFETEQISPACLIYNINSRDPFSSRYPSKLKEGFWLKTPCNNLHHGFTKMLKQKNTKWRDWWTKRKILAMKKTRGFPVGRIFEKYRTSSIFHFWKPALGQW